MTLIKLRRIKGDGQSTNLKVGNNPDLKQLMIAIMILMVLKHKYILTYVNAVYISHEILPGVGKFKCNQMKKMKKTKKTRPHPERQMFS